MLTLTSLHKRVLTALLGLFLLAMSCTTAKRITHERVAIIRYTDNVVDTITTDRPLKPRVVNYSDFCSCDVYLIRYLPK